MIIRHIQPADIPAVLHLGGMMHEESAMHVLDLSPAKIADTCYQIIEYQHLDPCIPPMFCAVAVHNEEIIGMIGGYIAAPVYTEDQVAWDILCYVRPDFRGSRAFIGLIKAYVKWARSTPAKMIFLTTSTGINHEKTSEIYKRLGFTQQGGVFLLGGS